MMIDAEVPIQMRYERIIPKGFPCVYKEWDLSPVTGNKNWIASDVIRFNFSNNSTGVLDRLRSYIEITVSTNVEDCPVGLLQMDNSAQSFIQTMVLYSNNAQIERIHQYGALAAYLNDTGMNEFITQGREQQGFGYGSFDTMPFGKPSGSGSIDALKNTQWGSYRSNGLIKPTMPNVFIYDQQVEGSRYSAAKITNKVVSGLNPYLFPTTLSGGQFDATKTIAHKSVKQHGYYMNIRGQYLANFLKTNSIESTSSIPCYQLDLDQSVFINGGYKQTSFVSPQNTDGTIVYQTTVPSQINQVLFAGVSSGSMRAHKLSTANYGFANLFSPAFSRGTFQPLISPTVRQVMLKQGRILETKQALAARKFHIPLLSSVIGILAQQSQFTLIPLNALNGCILELTLDPYAMFTSGYKDISQGDINGMTYQQKRAYYIQNIEYKLHTYHYIDNQIVSYIQNSLYKQINLTTNFWVLAGQYKVPANSGPQNSYAVSCRVKNLNQLVSLFISTDYLKYSFCRKHYRLSNNVTQFYCKIGADYLPPNPHRGNGGNPASQSQHDDNSVFLKNIYYSNGYLFSQTPLPRINPYNFALNQRPYDVHNRQAYFAPQMYNSGSTYVFGSNSVNADTAMGYAWIHENRCVGKAAYVLNFSPFTKQSTVLKGLNVSGVQDFYVCFETSGNNVYENDQLHLIFARVSGMVRYGQSRIQTYGR